MDVATGLLIAATVATAVATGATLDQTFKQLPARHRIGAHAYADYARAADLSNGLIWYPIMGVGATAVTVAAVVAGLIDKLSTLEVVAMVSMALGTAGFTAATAFAAPTLHRLRHGTDAPAQVLDRFARFNGARAVAVAVTLAATVWALVMRLES